MKYMQSSNLYIIFVRAIVFKTLELGILYDGSDELALKEAIQQASTKLGIELEDDDLDVLIDVFPDFKQKITYAVKGI